MKKHNKFYTEIKAIEDEDRTIIMTGSTENVDRVGDIVKMDGVDLTNYLKNPVILFNHDYDKVVGKALEVSVIDAKLVFKIQFADTEFGREIYYLIKNGYINASSIGFTGKEYTGNEYGGFTFTKIELLELSIVSVPCNPNALIQLRKDYSENRVSKDLFEALGGNMKAKEKAGAKISKANVDTIKEAIKLLSSLIGGDEADKPEEDEKRTSADTVKTDATNENKQEEEKEETKSFSNEEIIKEILKSLGEK